MVLGWLIIPRFSEVNSGLFYKTAAEREKLLTAEREFITRRVNKIIELKKKVCVEKDGKTPGFVVINQKVCRISLLTYRVLFSRELIRHRWTCLLNMESWLFVALNVAIWNVCN